MSVSVFMFVCLCACVFVPHIHVLCVSFAYVLSISDTTNSRFEIVEANLIHGPSGDSTIEAYLTVFGSTTSYTDPLCTFTADINDGNVRLLATNISSDSTVFKFQRVLIDL